MLTSFFLILLQDAQPAPAPPPTFAFAKPRLIANGWPDETKIPIIFDADGDGFGDLVVVGTQDRGHIEFARNVRNGKLGSGAIGVTIPEGVKLDPLASIIVRKEPGQKSRLFFKKDDGVLYHLAAGAQGTYQIEKDTEPVDSQPASQPASRPASASVDFTIWTRERGPLPGDFDGDLAADEIREDKIYFSKNPAATVDAKFLKELPPKAKYTFGDYNGDGKDDILVLRYDDTWRIGRDLTIQLSYASTDTDYDGDGLANDREVNLKSDPLDADTDHDGLFDGWEVLGEGGIDLPALGASPIHKDCIVYLQRYDNTDGAHCKREMDRCVKTWSELTNKNPDGTTGIKLIPIWLGTLPIAGGQKSWWELGDQNLPKEARGLAHYMNIANGGGGQAAENSDMGCCSAQSMYATFLHEFGHQVGLTHSGGPLPAMTPIYTSLMNYAYSYGFNNDYNQIHYSRGALASLVLNEQKLSERVTVPHDQLTFLEKGPFTLKLKSDADGTWIDWNRNGIFDPGFVRADITDTYGVDGGMRHLAGKTVFAPAVTVHNDKLLLFGVNREKKLFLKVNLDEGKWTEETFLSQINPAGDPWAVSTGKTLLLFVPTESGVAELAGTDHESLTKAKPAILEDSKSCDVSAVLYKYKTEDKMLILLWRGPEQPVRFAERRGDGTYTSARDLAGLMSAMCPGAAADPATGELCIGTTVVKKENGKETRKWRLTRLQQNAEGSFVETSSAFVGGPAAGWVGNSRPVLLFETGPDIGPQGRLHFLGVGWTDPPNRNGCFWDAMTIGDKSQNDGWRLRRYYDEWTTSKSPIGACWHKNDLVLAFRWFGNVHGDEDDNLLVSHRGLGIQDSEIRDFDDVTYIAEIGLARSIAWRLGVIK
ncbi:MAG: hypothetical protein ACKVS6_10220 [Planctomycetota bacterium]